ncbi:hypothetical protein CH568_004250 [Haemophilus influenzae]
MTALTSELTSELILRQKQYEYYREKLLSEEELGKVGFEWKCLKNIFNIFAGGMFLRNFIHNIKLKNSIFLFYQTALVINLYMVGQIKQKLINLA